MMESGNIKTDFVRSTKFYDLVSEFQKAEVKSLHIYRMVYNCGLLNHYEIDT